MKQPSRAKEQAGSLTLGLSWTEGGVLQVRAITGPLTIGRSSPCDIRLSDPAVSRIHCRVQVRGDEVVVDATRSTNGIITNGQRVARASLREGDSFKIGALNFRVVRQSARLRGTHVSSHRLPFRNPWPIVAAAICSLFVSVVIVLILLLSTAGQRQPSLRSEWQASSEAINQRDAQGFVQSLGGNKGDANLLSLVRSTFESLPDGTAVEVTSVYEGEPHENLRTDNVQLRLTVPGEIPELISLNVLQAKVGDAWQPLTVVPVKP